jgi:predicted ArsR family transcriptional regulator
MERLPHRSLTLMVLRDRPGPDEGLPTRPAPEESVMSSPTTARPEASSLVGLLGETRGAIVELLQAEGPQPVARIAGHLGVSEVATRRHLGVLIGEDIIEERDQRSSGGRPATCFGLTERAMRLFPQTYDRFASDAMEFLADTHGREGMLSFLRWRVDREVDALADAVADGPLPSRLERLAAALSAAGFASDVEGEAGAFRLVQRHCTIEEVARDHPEICAYEAAAFARVLGTDARLSRRETIATGASSCVCHVAPLTEVTTPGAAAAASMTTTTPNPSAPSDDEGARP